MKRLIRERIPHAPQMGLFVRPDVPVRRLQNALMDYGPDVKHEEVVALYDATLSGNAKDGAVFAEDRFVFQNTDLQTPQTVRYDDLVGVEVKSRWLGIGGKRVELTINRGRATFDLSMDFSGQPDAAEYVANFLEAAMMKDVSFETPASAPSSDEGTDVDAVLDALEQLRVQGKLSERDHQKLLDALNQ